MATEHDLRSGSLTHKSNNNKVLVNTLSILRSACVSIFLERDRGKDRICESMGIVEPYH